MSNVFKVKRRRGPTVGYKVGAMLGNAVKKGDIGIEIEVEGNTFKKEGVPSPWKYTHDGSLRGEDNAEYVLRNPIPFSEVPAAIKTLWDMFNDHGSVLDESNRTSVHVHLNAQPFHLNRLASFLALYFSVEEILTEWCGDHRVGNLFCLRVKDAPSIVSALSKFIADPSSSHVIHDGFHYAGLNAHALIKFGSLEIRALRGVTDPDTILQWVSILQYIYELSAEFKDPREICSKFSGYGCESYLEMVLGPNLPVVMSGVSMDIHQVQDSLYEGIRYAQDLCYCRDWSEFKEESYEPDPFGRSLKQVLESESWVEAIPTPVTPVSLYQAAVTTSTSNTPSGFAVAYSNTNMTIQDLEQALLNESQSIEEDYEW